MENNLLNEQYEEIKTALIKENNGGDLVLLAKQKDGSVFMEITNVKNYTKEELISASWYLIDHKGFGYNVLPQNEAKEFINQFCEDPLPFINNEE